MKIGKPYISIFIFFSAYLNFFSAAIPQEVQLARIEPLSIEQSVDSLCEKIGEAVRASQGDLNHQHIHLVFGFSTGHFNRDPLGAEAARSIAWGVVRNLLIPGDQVSSYAWELHVWDYPRSRPNPVEIHGEEDKARVRDLWPLTAQQGSQGGHDTERAIVEIVREIRDDPGAVIVLLTNTAASISIPGIQLMGANHPDYQAVLQK